jgi:hypothetical protein
MFPARNRAVNQCVARTGYPLLLLGYGTAVEGGGMPANPGADDMTGIPLFAAPN